MLVKSLILGHFATNCHIVFCEETKEAVVFDPGFEPERVNREIDKSGCAVRYIFLTHGHYDHISGVSRVKEHTGAKVVISEEDAFHLTAQEREGFFKGLPLEPCPPDITLKGGEALRVGNLEFKALKTPGHTSGCMCFLSGSHLFSGDTLFYEECGRCDLPTGNYQQMLSSLAALSRLPGDYTVYPGHGERTTLSHEREFNPYMREGLEVFSRGGA